MIDFFFKKIFFLYICVYLLKKIFLIEFKKKKEKKI